MTFHTSGERRRFTQDAGVTLIELLVVLVILSVIATMTLPALRHPPESVRLEVAARNLASALRLSRATAIARHSEIVVGVDAERRTYKSAAVPLTRIDPDIALELVVAAPERRSESSGGFRFFPDGTSTGGHIDLSSGKRRMRIGINWLTGEARIDFMNGIGRDPQQ